MPEEELDAKDLGDGVRLVLPRVLGRGAVDRLEHGDRVAVQGARGDAQAPREPRAEVGEDVAEEVGGDDDVVLAGGFFASCIAMLSTSRSSEGMSGYFAAISRNAVWKSAPVVFMMFALWTAVTFRRFARSGELEGEPDDPVRRLPGDDVHRLGGRVLPVDPVLHPRVESLGRLSDDDEVGLGEPGPLPGDRPGGPHRGVEVELLAESDVDRAESRSRWGS